MFYRNNFLSERTQIALLILYALRREYLRSGEGVNKKEISVLTGFSATIVNNYLIYLLAMKLVGVHKRKFHPESKLDIVSLYELIEHMDGWVHLGNANLESITGNLADRMYLSGCEAFIRKGVYDFLKSIRLLSLLPGAEEPLAESSMAVTGHSEPAGSRVGRASAHGKTLDLSATPVLRPGRSKRSGTISEILMMKEDFS